MRNNRKYKEWEEDWINHQVGRNIKQVRNRKGITQKELGAMIEIEKDTISSFECGRSNIHIKHIIRIIKGLDCSILDIVKYI